MKKDKGKQKGFTLIEILIVLTAMAALIGIALPTLTSMQEEAKILQAKGDLRTLQTAMESYYMHNNRTYPTALTDLTTATPQVISAVPNDPFTGAVYADPIFDTNDRYYVLYSQGQDSTATAPTIADTGIVTADPTIIYISNSHHDVEG